jgi:hypothetical protein
MDLKWTFLLATIAWSCTATTGPEVRTAALDQPFDLRVGERARLDEYGLELHFAEVAQDSRCPSNALILCVWEGDGAVIVEVTPADDATRPDTLHTTLDPKVVTIGSFALQLVRLDPYPEDVTPIPTDEYRARFVLTRSP